MVALTVEMALVFAIIVVVFVLFVTEPVPIDVTALATMVALIMLGPWMGVSSREGVSGFSNPATITILAMIILSEEVRRTGAIKRLESIPVRTSTSNSAPPSTSSARSPASSTTLPPSPFCCPW